MSGISSGENSGINHPDLVNFNIAEINQDWRKSEIWSKKWVLIVNYIFITLLDIYVYIVE